jgi:hypothetical protein
MRLGLFLLRDALYWVIFCDDGPEEDTRSAADQSIRPKRVKARKSRRIPADRNMIFKVESRGRQRFEH